MTRLVFTTDDSRRGQHLLERMCERGIRFDAVLVLTGGFGPPVPRRDEPTMRRLARWPRAAASGLRRKIRFYRHRRRWYAARCAQVLASGDMNSRRLRRDLARLAPDYLVLGGGGILAPDLIETAQAGVLNAHPALLPWVRGCGVVGYSLEHGIALGATVHFVDRGIDTGPLIERRLLAVPPGPVPLRTLAAANDELAAAMMADVLEDILLGHPAPVGVPQHRRFPLFLYIPPESRPGHDELAEAGRAGELFEAWSRYCADTDRWTLPRSDDDLAVASMGVAEPGTEAAGDQ